LAGSGEERVVYDVWLCESTGCMTQAVVERPGSSFSSSSRSHPDAVTTGSVKTELKRLVKIYDWMKYGTKKEPPEGGS